MINEGMVGPQVLADGQVARIRQGKSAEVVVTELHGKYYEQAYRGRIFRAVQAAGGVLVTTVGTTASFALANPLNSGVNLSVLKLYAAIKVLPGTPIIGYYGVYVNTNPAGAAVTGTALTPFGHPLGSGVTPAGKPFTTATLPAAPSLYDILQQKTATAEAPLSPPPPFVLSYDGDFLLGPGSTLSIMQDASDTTAATMVCGVEWEEIAV
jgi:hypothetical protein